MSGSLDTPWPHLLILGGRCEVSAYKTRDKLHTRPMERTPLLRQISELIYGTRLPGSWSFKLGVRRAASPGRQTRKGWQQPIRSVPGSASGTRGQACCCDRSEEPA